jgi:hypothetical protein
VFCPGGGMVDARDLKSLGSFFRAGSSPALGTISVARRHSQVAKAGACKALILGSNPSVASNK